MICYNKALHEWLANITRSNAHPDINARKSEDYQNLGNYPYNIVYLSKGRFSVELIIPFCARQRNEKVVNFDTS